MKMNRKSCVLLNLAIAASLFAFAACSDYLEDFQDKYDDGKAFAEISSDSDSSDGELSSSSKGNGDAESSDSTDSSSSATDPGSSSSVTESSSAFEPCKGTVIYDASKDSLNSIFGYPFMADDASEMQASSKGIKAKLQFQKSFFSLALADLSNDKTRDIETWGGLCIEYSSDGQADFVLVNDSLEKVRGLLSNELPVTNGDKASFKWHWSENEKLQEKQVERGYSNEPLSINKVSRLHFDNYYLPKTTTITIFKITTINEVDLDVGSSSSVAESSSSAFESCTGTVIYDYKNPGKLGLDLQFFTNGTATKLPENKQGIELTSNTVKDFAIFTLSKNDLHDVSSWEGLCVEYSSNEDIPFYLADSLENIEQINLPANGHFKEISWADTTSRKISLNGRVSFNKFDAFSFEKITTQKVVTISRITTIAKVAPGSSSSVAESSSSAFEPCKGSVIYDASMDSLYGVFGYPFMTEYAELEANSSGVKATMKYAESEYQTLFLNLANSSNNETKDIEAWEGVCIEYSSDGNPSLNLNTPHEQNAWAATSLPQTKNNKETFTWRWNDIKQKGKAFSINKVGQLVFYTLASTKTTTITIHKITTLKPVDLGLNSVYNGLEPVSECSSNSEQIIYAPAMGNKSYYDTYFYATYQKEKKAIYNSDQGVLILNMDAEGTTNMYQMNMISVLQTTTRSWDGLCIEYEADHPLSWLVTYINNVKNDGDGWEPNSQAQVLLPKTEGIKAYKISWEKFAQLTDNDFVGMINSMRFEHGTADEYYNLDQSYNKDNYQRMVDFKIQKITSYK